MPFNFDNEAAETNEKFSAEISKLTTLKMSDVQRLFPTKVDKENLLALMKIVQSSASRNKKAAALQNNLQNLASSVIKLLEVLT
tara:strand:- start:3793 stop:4044 length:252 start_codon:yes stop_codon:yes gene_type:complete